MRLTTFSMFFSGLGLAAIAVAYIFDWMQDNSILTGSFAIWAWLLGLGLLILVIIMSIVNTFTEMTGFVHPEDKLVSNMLVFLTTIVTILMFGVLVEGEPYQEYLFTISSMILIAYVFLFIFVYFSGSIAKGGETGQVKEMTARFMLVSLLLGVIMSGLMVFLEWVYDSGLAYGGASTVLGIFAVVLVVLVVVYLGRKYEPVGQ